MSAWTRVCAGVGPRELPPDRCGLRPGHQACHRGEAQVRRPRQVRRLAQHDATRLRACLHRFHASHQSNYHIALPPATGTACGHMSITHTPIRMSTPVPVHKVQHAQNIRLAQCLRQELPVPCHRPGLVRLVLRCRRLRHDHVARRRPDQQHRSCAHRCTGGPSAPCSPSGDAFMLASVHATLAAGQEIIECGEKWNQGCDGGFPYLASKYGTHLLETPCSHPFARAALDARAPSAHDPGHLDRRSRRVPGTSLTSASRPRAATLMPSADSTRRRATAAAASWTTSPRASRTSASESPHIPAARLAACRVLCL